MPPFLSALAARLSITGIIIAVLALLLMVQTVRIEGFSVWPVHVHGLRERLRDSEAGRSTDRARYEQAQKDAKAANKADVARIKAAQEANNADTKRKYDSDLARLRAGGLRKDLAPAAGSPGPGGAGANPNSACRADAENVCVPRSLVMRAGEIELARNSLIDWLKAQLAVPR